MQRTLLRLQLGSVGVGIREGQHGEGKAGKMTMKAWVEVSVGSGENGREWARHDREQ